MAPELSIFPLCVPLGIASYGGQWDWRGEGGREKKNLTSTLGQETRDSHSDPAFLTIITSKFLCGISVSRGAAHPLNTKANKIIKLKNKAKNHNSVVILLNQTRQESRAMLATL